MLSHSTGSTILNSSSQSMQSAYDYYIFFPFYSRACPYLCGMMTAYVLHTSGEPAMKCSKHLNASLWVSSISIIFAIMAGTFPFHSRDYVESKLLNSAFIAASHLGWSVSISWIILACHSGTGGLVNSFLSLPIWKPLSRIGLSVHVTHILSVVAIFGTQKQPAYFNEFLKTHLYLGDLGLSFGVAVLAFLTFESSVLTIEKSLRFPRKKK